MLAKVNNWLNLADKKKHMLTFSGPPEVGKTHLLKEVNRLYSTYESNFPHRKWNYPECLYIIWSELSSHIFENPMYVDRIRYSGLVIIEDFLSENFKKENGYNSIVLDFAYRVINVRVGKPTLIDTNKSIEEIEMLDRRTSSRLFRESGDFFEIPKNTTPYLSR